MWVCFNGSPPRASRRSLWTPAMKTKQSSDLLPDPDLQEHQRLILRASRQSTERRARRPALDAVSAPTWQLVLVGTGAIESCSVSLCDSAGRSDTGSTPLVRAHLSIVRRAPHLAQQLESASKLYRTIYIFAALFWDITLRDGATAEAEQCFRMNIVAYTRPASPWLSNPIRRTHVPAGSRWRRIAKTLLKGISRNCERRA